MIRRTPLARGNRLRPVSKKRVGVNKIYRALRISFLDEKPICQVWLQENGWVARGAQTYAHKLDLTWTLHAETLHSQCNAPYSTEVHHKKGRGKYLLDVSTWLAVCRSAHNYIHDNPKEAEEKGWLIRR